MTRQPSGWSDDELADRVRLYSERYSAGRHKGRMFAAYAGLVTELLDRMESTHTEYAPALDNGLVLENLATDDPTNLPPRMRRARRTVTPWEYDDEVV